MKKYICLILGLFCITRAFCYEFSKVQKQKIYDFKEQLYFESDETELINIISDFKDSLAADKSIPKQEFYCLRCELLIESLNFIEDKNVQKESLVEMLNLQKEIEQFLRKEKDISAELLVAYADLESRLVGSLNGGEMYRLSMESKDIYEKALKINKNFAPAYSGFGNWLYFAPAVAGGGFNASLKMFNKAIKYSENTFDLYLNYIYRSQVFYKLGNKKACSEDLDAAELLYKNDILIKNLRVKNEKGKCFFD